MEGQQQDQQQLTKHLPLESDQYISNNKKPNAKQQQQKQQQLEKKYDEIMQSKSQIARSELLPEQYRYLQSIYIYEGDEKCQVCLENDSNESDLETPDILNSLVICDGCNGCVHQQCHGFNILQQCSQDKWFCQRCDQLINNPKHDFSKMKCYLCGIYEGILVNMCFNILEQSEIIWVHPICLQFNQHIKQKDDNKMNVDIEVIEGKHKELLSLKNKICCVCNTNFGYAIQCDYTRHSKNKIITTKVQSCKKYFHPYCASKQQLIYADWLMFQLQPYPKTTSIKGCEILCSEHIINRYNYKKKMTIIDNELQDYHQNKTGYENTYVFELIQRKRMFQSLYDIKTASSGVKESKGKNKIPALKIRSLDSMNEDEQNRQQEIFNTSIAQKQSKQNKAKKIKLNPPQPNDTVTVTVTVNVAQPPQKQITQDDDQVQNVNQLEQKQKSKKQRLKSLDQIKTRHQKALLIDPESQIICNNLQDENEKKQPQIKQYKITSSKKQKKGTKNESYNNSSDDSFLNESVNENKDQYLAEQETDSKAPFKGRSDSESMISYEVSSDKCDNEIENDIDNSEIIILCQEYDQDKCNEQAEESSNHLQTSTTDKEDAIFNRNNMDFNNFKSFFNKPFNQEQEIEHKKNVTVQVQQVQEGMITLGSLKQSLGMDQLITFEFAADRREISKQKRAHEQEQINLLRIKFYSPIDEINYQNSINNAILIDQDNEDYKDLPKDHDLVRIIEQVDLMPDQDIIEQNIIFSRVLLRLRNQQKI